MTAKKMMLTTDESESAIKAFDKVSPDFLAAKKLYPNVVGLGIGIKWTGGEPTGEPALLVLVTEKVKKKKLGSKELIPQKLAGMQTDVVAIGRPSVDDPIFDLVLEYWSRRIRPVKGGFSIGHKEITAGTIATCVSDILPGGRINSPMPGMSNPLRPPKYYILSNNHVLAKSNNAAIGDPILQPGPYDGGIDPIDRVARLSRFIPITFEPPTPRDQHYNLVDAAIAEGPFHGLDREIFWIGHVRGWRRKKNVNVGMRIQKTGRTTKYTTGRIIAVNAKVDVYYGGGKVARFTDQIVTTNISAGGDSGSLVLDMDQFAIGLLFAGSLFSTIVNQIENVRSFLQVEIGEQVI